MSYYAKVNNNIVLEVIAADASFFDTFVDTSPGTWIQTSYNTHGGIYYIPNSNPPEPDPDQSKALRANYAGIGYNYDPTVDINGVMGVFYGPIPLDIYGNPCNSWTVGSPTWIWQPPNPPGPAPTEGGPWGWDEATLSWVYIGPPTP